MRVWGKQLGRHVAIGVLCAQLVGLIDGLAALWAAGGAAGSGWLGPLLAAAVMAPAGVLVGVGSFVVVRSGFVALPGGAEREQGAAPAVLAARVLGAAALCWAAGHYLRFSERLQDEAFAADLAVFALALGLLLLPPFVAALARVLGGGWRVTTRLPERWRRRLAELGVLAACAGLALWLWLFMREYAALLGPLQALPYACLLALAALVAHRSGLFAALASGRRARGLWLGSALALGAAGVAQSALRDADAVLQRTLGPARVSALCERLADIDGDGSAGLFGGRDCAPFDRRRGPFAFDVPGNRVDEDCSGRDSKPRAAQESARIPDALLSPELVGKRHVVLIVVDALRADRVGLGRRGSLTPVIDRLAQRSVVFTEAFSQSPSTRVSFPSFLSGREPARLHWVRTQGWWQSNAAHPMLAELLKRHGYTTGLVINRWMFDRLTRLQRGYDEVLDNRRSNDKPVSPALAGPSSTARAIEFIGRALQSRGRPFFLTVHYENPHAPYDDLTQFGFPARSAQPIDRYDGEVRYVDHQIGHLLDHLAVTSQTAGDTIVILTADHGEEFGEHGGRYHDRECYRESTHVPLVVHVPQLPPARVAARVALTDIAPTVLALTGAPAVPGFDGRNLIAGDAARYAQYPDEPVSCTYFSNKNPNTRVESVRDGYHFYLERNGRTAFELYDTAADRGERKNLAARPASAPVIARLRAKLRRLTMDQP